MKRLGGTCHCSVRKRRRSAKAGVMGPASAGAENSPPPVPAVLDVTELVNGVNTINVNGYIQT